MFVKRINEGITAIVQVRDTGDTSDTKKKKERERQVWEIWAKVKLAELGDGLDMKGEGEKSVKDDSQAFGLRD